MTMMTLHQDPEGFRVLLEELNHRTSLRMDVLEKDYYVSLILQELAQKQQNGLKAYFKGGTALYKALKSIRRFSEDIDLSVDITGCSRTKADKLMRESTKGYVSFARIPEDDVNNRSEVIAAYSYSPLVIFDATDRLQRFGHIKIEATSFTISEPTAPLMIAPALYELATPAEKKILEGSYHVCEFSIETITLERIFIDKLFAAEAYFRRCESPERAFDASKHIYDLCVLFQTEVIRSFITDERAVAHIMEIRLKEEIDRRDGIPGITIKQFGFWDLAINDERILKAFKGMQRVYVFLETDMISQATARAMLSLMKMKIMEVITS